jgi:hypothetical protein
MVKGLVVCWVLTAGEAVQSLREMAQSCGVAEVEDRGHRCARHWLGVGSWSEVRAWHNRYSG